MQLRTLGALQLEGSDFTRPKGLLLLSYLALEGAKSRLHLQQFFFPNSEDASASLRVLLTQIRRGCPEALLEQNGTLRLGIACDATMLLEALEAGQLEIATQLYTGAFLQAVRLRDFELEDWMLSNREYLARRVSHACLQLAENAAASQAYGQASQQAAAAHRIAGQAALEPDALLRLLRVLEISGSALAARVRTEVQDLGMNVPNTILPKEATKLEPLPSYLTSFIPRHTEQDFLENALLLRSERFITVLGFGGSGKTRLALEVLRSIQQQAVFENVKAIMLEAAPDEAAASREIAKALGITENTDLWAQIAAQIGSSKTLLLLDNLEQLTELALSFEQLLLACPNLQIVATSRERLGLTCETVLDLGGFTNQQAALQLFTERARKSKASQAIAVFEPETRATLLQILAIVEFYPLGIELCAALSGLLPLPQMLANLQSSLEALEGGLRKARHSGLRAVFNWSWALLKNLEQQSLARLAVFAESPTRADAVFVSDSNLAVLNSLVNKSLLQVLANGRYRLHPLILEFSREKLAAKPKEQQTAAARHASLFLGWLERHASQTRTDQGRWVLGRFEADFGNICAAWRWLCQHPDAAQFERLQDCVQCFDAKAQYNVGVTLFQAAADALRALPVLPVLALAQLEVNTAWLLFNSNQLLQAQKHGLAALELGKMLDDQTLRIKTLNTLALINRELGDYPSAIQSWEEILVLAQNDPHRTMMTRNNLAGALAHTGQIEAALEQYQIIIQMSYTNDQQYARAIAISGITFLQVYCQKIYFDKNLSKLLEAGLALTQDLKLTNLEVSIRVCQLKLFVESKQIVKAQALLEEIDQKNYRQLFLSDPLFLLVSAQLSFQLNDIRASSQALFASCQVAFKNQASVSTALCLIQLAQFVLQQQRQLATQLLYFTNQMETFPVWAREEAASTIAVYQLLNPNEPFGNEDLKRLMTSNSLRVLSLLN